MHNQNNENELLSRVDALERELGKYKELYRESVNKTAEASRRASEYKTELEIIKHSGSWVLTAPFRWIKFILMKIPPISIFVKLVKNIVRFGFKYTFKKIKTRFKMRKMAKKKVVYTEDVLRAQRETVFERAVKFSVIVPLYNTDTAFLEEMIGSVSAQTYQNWELCLADGSDGEHPEVERCVRRLAEADGRIKYRRLEKNLGISENTNAAIEMASGDFIALFDHDDKLHPAALFEMARVINEQGADFIYTDEAKFTKNEAKDAYDFFFKPDFSPDMLRSYNYICHFTAFSRELMDEVGRFRSAFDGSQDYDMILRLTEKAKKIVHIPTVLYYWRCHAASVASNVTAKPYTLAAARSALAEHLMRVGLVGAVEDSTVPSTYRIRYEIEDKPKVSIIIPNKDHTDDLSTCLESVYKRSTYPNFEVVIVENNSKEEKTFEYYKQAEEKYPNLKVVYWEHEFNYSKINNFGFNYISGEYTVLLNNDIEILTPEWIEEMLMFVQRSDVGAAGMMLYYADETIQHAGVVLGIGKVAGHSHKYFKRGDNGYFSRLTIAQNFSAVTAAALMVKTSVYKEVGGLEEEFAVAFNDVDFCMKIRERGYNIVWTPYAEAYHYESKSRGYEDDRKKMKRFEAEIQRFLDRWGEKIAAGDPYYNPNLTLESEDFSLR